MFLTILFILIITCGGLLLTYLFAEDESFLWRISAGNIVGSALYGLIAFLAGCAFGLNAATALISLVITLLPLILLSKLSFREKILSDIKSSRNFQWQSAIYYFAFFVLFYFFFERAMMVTPEGIFTGGSHNLGDLPFHLGAITRFVYGENLPPENPSFAFAKFTYPFMTDFIISPFVVLGAKIQDAMLWQNISLGISLVVLCENFAFRLTKNKLAGRLAPVILFLSGGLGFIIFFRDYWHDGRPFFEFLWHLPDAYTIREKGVRWGNSSTTLFITQRSLLFGMPLVLIVLTYLWKVFSKETSEIKDEQQPTGKISTHHPLLATIIVGLFAGMLPLIHVHSLAVLFVVCAVLFFFSLGKWRLWLVFALSVAVIAVPELLWAMTGSATRLKEFIDWNFGWDARDEDVFIFWLKNTGLFIPLLIAALFLIREKHGGNGKNDDSYRNKLLIFYLPFVLIFFASNLVKFAPWEWDNIKLLIYWFVASIPFVAWLLAHLWEKNLIYKFISIACLIILTFSGALDVWRVVSRQINYQVFSQDAVKIAEQIRQKTTPDALFLNAPTYNSAVVLSGRRSLMRYVGHLSSYGIDYAPREDEVRRIYEGTALAETFLKKNNIDYVIISPEERSNLTVNEQFFSKYPVIAESGAYRVYQVK